MGSTACFGLGRAADKRHNPGMRGFARLTVTWLPALLWTGLFLASIDVTRGWIDVHAVPLVGHRFATLGLIFFFLIPTALILIVGSRPALRLWPHPLSGPGRRTLVGSE